MAWIRRPGSSQRGQLRSGTGRPSGVTHRGDGSARSATPDAPRHAATTIRRNAWAVVCFLLAICMCLPLTSAVDSHRTATAAATGGPISIRGASVMQPNEQQQLILYGTSLPVGGTDTHAVLTGHRGMVNALMFTRIDELVVGDDFYISVMGETLAYEVDAITVILPTEGTKYLRVRPGEDRVTLMTCTPYGVNTHRLLVSGHRVSMPQPAPYPQDARRDTKLIAWVAGLGTGVVTIAAWGVIRRRSRWMPVHHAAVWRRL